MYRIGSETVTRRALAAFDMNLAVVEASMTSAVEKSESFAASCE